MHEHIFVLLADSSLEDRTTMSPVTICQLTELSLCTTYFEFSGGVLWTGGWSLPQVIAKIYMEGFEEDALETAKDQPSLWVCYVDDTFVIWPHCPDRHSNFHSHLNGLRNSIQFTIEKEQSNVPGCSGNQRRKPHDRLQKSNTHSTMTPTTIRESRAE